MAQQPPPAYNPNYPPPQAGGYPPPQQPGPYPPQQNPYGQPAPQPQVYVHQKQTPTTSDRIGAGIGGAFATVLKSGKDLTKGSGKAASSVGKTLGNAAAGLLHSGGHLASGVTKGFQSEYDRTNDSPLMRCFEPGAGIQLIGRTGQGCLRALPNGFVDGNGMIGNDYSCHWLVVSRFENKVILRNGAFPQYHLSNANNQTVATGVGDAASVFRLHETMSHYVTFQHDMSNQYVGLDHQKNIRPANLVNNGSKDSEFEVFLVYSPSGHVYKASH